ncbi:hypothetical protein [Nonomuraea sp. JJY05]|uniref:hypothetical protein n=1 Tax=Nonomuraea sp. JJY05 TaxID=3350255 RepID=UPI00373EBF43
MRGSPIYGLTRYLSGRGRAEARDRTERAREALAQIVGAALPDMRRRLHTQLTGLRWIVDAYVLLVAMLLLSGGVFAGRFGRKRVFLAGAVTLAGAVFTGLGLVRSRPVARGARSTDSPGVTTPS